MPIYWVDLKMEESKDGEVVFAAAEDESHIPVIEKQIKRVAIKPAESVK